MPSDRRVLWAATLAATVASALHLVSLFQGWEYTGPVGLTTSILAAVAIDLGLLASMAAVGWLAERGQDTRGPLRTVILLAFVSTVANVWHSVEARITTVGVPESAGAWAAMLGGALVVSGALPLVVIRLSRLLAQVGEVEHRTPLIVRGEISEISVPKIPGKRAAILAAAAENPEASRRSLAGIAGTSDALVRTLEREGALTQDGGRWRVNGNEHDS